MNGIATLSFDRAIRWALVWPAGVLAACLVTAIVLYVRTGGDFAFSLQLQSPYGIPQRVIAVVGVSAVFLGPSLAFLAVWKATKR